MLSKITTPIEDLQNLTVEQLKDALTANMTKRDLLMVFNDESETIADNPVRTYQKDNQIKSQLETFRDIETNEIISTKQITWTYYPSSEVDEITIVESDSKGAEVSRKVIKHYIDGRQPTVTEVKE